MNEPEEPGSATGGGHGSELIEGHINYGCTAVAAHGRILKYEEGRLLAIVEAGKREDSTSGKRLERERREAALGAKALGKP